ncbi:unnamed protein product [Tenebrio molitor]|nr:unnamed protein product [Tenebrio molitor]
MQSRGADTIIRDNSMVTISCFFNKFQFSESHSSNHESFDYTCSA